MVAVTSDTGSYQVSVKSVNSTSRVAIFHNQTVMYAKQAIASADLAKQWAIKTDGTVDGSEYSSKYYAEQAKTAETTAIENINASLTAAQNDITTATEETLAEVEAATEEFTELYNSVITGSTVLVSSFEVKYDDETLIFNTKYNTAEANTVALKGDVDSIEEYEDTEMENVISLMNTKTSNMTDLTAE